MIGSEESGIGNNQQLTKREIPHVLPVETLPTPEMIDQGKRDFISFLYTLPPEENTLRSLLLSPAGHPIRGCFMGLTAYSSYMMHGVKPESVSYLQDRLKESTQGRCDIACFPISDDDEIPTIYLINNAATRRIISAYHSLFPQEAKKNPREWINNLMTEPSAQTTLYKGLLSGFPPESVMLFSKKQPSDKSATIPGIGRFAYYGTDEENNYIETAKSVYNNSGTEELVSTLS